MEPLPGEVHGRVRLMVTHLKDARGTAKPYPLYLSRYGDDPRDPGASEVGSGQSLLDLVADFASTAGPATPLFPSTQTSHDGLITARSFYNWVLARFLKLGFSPDYTWYSLKNSAIKRRGELGWDVGRVNRYFHISVGVLSTCYFRTDKAQRRALVGGPPGRAHLGRGWYIRVMGGDGEWLQGEGGWVWVQSRFPTSTARPVPDWLEEGVRVEFEVEFEEVEPSHGVEGADHMIQWSGAQGLESARSPPGSGSGQSEPGAFDLGISSRHEAAPVGWSHCQGVFLGTSADVEPGVLEGSGADSRPWGFEGASAETGSDAFAGAEEESEVLVLGKPCSVCKAKGQGPKVCGFRGCIIAGVPKHGAGPKCIRRLLLERGGQTIPIRVV